MASVAVVFLSLSGVAFACGGGGGCDGTWGGSHCSERSDLVWVNPAATAPSATWVGCTISFTSSVLTVTVSNLAPGANCQFSGTLKNLGHQSVHLFSQIRAHEHRACPWFVYSDNVVGAVHPPSLAPGHTFSYGAEIALSSLAGNACQGASATFTVTLSTSGGNWCQGDPYGVYFGPYGGDSD